MTFYAIELENVCPAYGWQGGPEGDTEILPAKNRHEYRNSHGDLIRHRFVLPFQNIPSEDYLAYLKAAHVAMYARRHSFLVKDWLDWLAVSEPLETPDGSDAVQLTRTYTFGPVSRTRPITKPVAGAVVYENGIAKAGTLDTLTGLFTPDDPWASESTLTWSGEFRVPVRFDNEFLPFSIDNASRGQHVVNGQVDLVEVFGE